jgi:hypothetical protein
VPRDGFKEQNQGLANPDPPSLEFPGYGSHCGFSSKFYFLKKREKIKVLTFWIFGLKFT